MKGFCVTEEEQGIINRDKFFNLWTLGKLDRLRMSDGSFLWIGSGIIHHWMGAMMQEAHRTC